MGCVVSRIDQVEKVRICKERKRLMKQLLGYRQEFANAQLAYLRSLKNTGATLRQFTESELLELEETTSGFGFGFPPSPPLPLPPSPPPPPTFSPDLRKFEDEPPQGVEEIAEVDEDDSHSPPPPLPSSSWEYWDPFASPLPQCQKGSEKSEQMEDESWEETNTEFVEEREEAVVVVVDDEVNAVESTQESVELVDDDSSMMSWRKTKEAADIAVVVWRGKKTLTGIVKDLDEYFLKASAAMKEIAVFIDMDAEGAFTYQSIKENKRKRSNSAKVFSALTWSRSSKSLQSTREMAVSSGSGEPCKPGAHCITLQKLYSEEQKLYKDVKEEETAKVEYGKKSLLLQRQQEEHDFTKVEKTRLSAESLLSYVSSLQESINRSTLTVLKLRDEELHPQLITLASGLKHMWQTMYNCHKLQHHISQQLNQLMDQQSTEPTSEYHLQAAAQLQTEVASWYESFCKLIKFQKEYVKALSNWTEHTKCLEDSGEPHSGNSLKMHAFAEKWLQALDKLPDKMMSDAINSLSSAIHSIVLQQQEECNMHKRSDKLSRKLDRELTLLSDVEKKFAGSFSVEDANTASTSKHPLPIRRAKVEALKILADDETTKYLNSVKATRAMIVQNLQTSLPKVFQALMVYSSAYVHSFEVILSYATKSESEDVQATTTDGI